LLVDHQENLVSAAIHYQIISLGGSDVCAVADLGEGPRPPFLILGEKKM